MPVGCFDNAETLNAQRPTLNSNSVTSRIAQTTRDLTVVLLDHTNQLAASPRHIVRSFTVFAVQENMRLCYRRNDLQFYRGILPDEDRTQNVIDRSHNHGALPEQQQSS